MGDLLLVRHGETEWSRSGQHTSFTDLPLTEHGEEQAKSLAPLLSGRTFCLALTSPLHRAVRTAELAGVAGAVPEPDLHEWDYGAYEGITTVEIHRTRPAWDLWTDGVPPGPDGRPGESPEEVGRRADRVLSRVDAALQNCGGDAVLVAHGHFLRVLTARRLGLPPAEGRLFQLATGTVSRLSTEHGRPVIAEWNIRP
ncbi:histidine phosphatase family protein [Streptomyces sp. NBC_00015]|uniref:histidine phosphatase family protein n=1 Tax=unclassified Streptomyces TaxID=2593676 RepID=UPI00225032EF|nr:histidine phosphatase family protein [Streptomyces sp. NBC_00103]MCX5372079.1 histidine phosphatase family protein [Streptomyces sp. NBC_00103]